MPLFNRQGQGQPQGMPQAPGIPQTSNMPQPQAPGMPQPQATAQVPAAGQGMPQGRPMAMPQGAPQAGTPGQAKGNPTPAAASGATGGKTNKKATAVRPDSAPEVPDKKKRESDKWEMTKRERIVLTLVSVVLGLVGSFFGIRYALNVRFLNSFSNGSYVASIPHTLTYLNFPDPYLPYQNFGCAAYMMGNYDYAASSFATALEKDPPHDVPYPSKECQIRINLALSLVKPLDVEHWSNENERQHLIQVLTIARDYLTEDGCANPEKDVFDGHSEDAEQLKKDIDAALEKLKDPNGGGSGDDDSDEEQDQGEQDQDEQDGDDEQGGGQSSRQNEERLKDRLNDRKSDSMQQRAEDQQSSRDFQSFSSGGTGGKSDGDEGGSGGKKSKTW